MSWLHEDHRFRLAIAVNDVGGGSAAQEITFDLATISDLDQFWDSIIDQVTGLDIVPTDADGNTVIIYDLNAFNYAARTGTVRMSGYTTPAEGMVLIWLYYSRTAAPDQTGAPTFVAPLTSSVEQGRAADRQIISAPERPGATSPRAEVSKASAEVLHLWWNLTALLEQRPDDSAGSRLYEELDYAQFDVELAGATQAAMFDETGTSFVFDPDGDHTWVRTTIKAGTTAVSYTAILTVGTTTGRVLEARAKLAVNDVDET